MGSRIFSEDESGINMMEILPSNSEFEAIYLEKRLDENFKKIKTKEKMRSRFFRTLKTGCECSGQKMKEFFFAVLPILHWLPKYDVKGNFLGDLAAGLTVGIVQIPQGMAYSLLASLPPITGMYVSFFPVLIYPLFGTSRHLSIGTFAVVSILISDVLGKRLPESFCPGNGVTQSTPYAAVMDNTTRYGYGVNASEVDCDVLYDKRKIELAVALSISVGMILLLMYVFQLGKVTVFLSESLVSGFVSGASIHVITSQIPKLFGIIVGRRPGPFALIYVYVDLFRRITEINWGTFVVSVCCIIFLMTGKEINERCRKKLPLSIPWELFIVIFSTIASYYGRFEQDRGIVVVGDIPTGITVTIPNPSDVTSLIFDAIPLAIVIFTVEISLCQMFAVKHGYEVNSNQELMALGASNIFSAFFSCFPSAASLSRSVIYEEIGGKTQMGGLLSSVVVLSVLLWIGPLFEPLPQASLAVIIIVNIRRLVLMWKNVKPLWKVSVLDALTWMVAWFSVVLFGVALGLVFGVCFSLMTVVLKTMNVKGSRIGPVSQTSVYRDVDKYETEQLTKKILIFRFPGPLYFANKDRFLEQLFEKLGYDPARELARQTALQNSKSVDSIKSVKTQEHMTISKKNMQTTTSLGNELKENGKTVRHSDSDSMTFSEDEDVILTDVTASSPVRSASDFENDDSRISHVIVDFSQCSFMDSDGAKIIVRLHESLTELGVHLMLANCNNHVRTCIHALLSDKEPFEYISIASAVAEAHSEIFRDTPGGATE